MLGIDRGDFWGDSRGRVPMLKFMFIWGAQPPGNLAFA